MKGQIKLAQKQNATAQQLLDSVVEGMKEKKAKNIVVLDMLNLKSAPADYFVICHGESDKQVEAIARSVDEVVKKNTGEDALHIEGQDNAEWILLDYFNVVVHVFQQEKRNFFDIEGLWGDARIQNIED
ncbi:MAG: ribosome silencing factor [Bacteroidota bacterium]|nr:ribosome silencing factor [Bacteroidota bacterium]